MCPHHPEFGADCDCRKPRPGMLLRAAAEFGISLGDSFMVGDKAVDVQAAANAKVTPILVRTGHGEDVPDVTRVADVAAAVAYIAERAT
jgi:D-glycero-D-manno-heptose 1,7-bisphosphate phosphatase